MAGDMCAAGCVWQGGHVWQGAMRVRRDSHCSGRYVSYWNAFLLPPANVVCEGYVFTITIMQSLVFIKTFIKLCLGLRT